MTGEMRKNELILLSKEASKLFNVILVILENEDHYPLFSGHGERRNLRLHNSVKRIIQDNFGAI